MRAFRVWRSIFLLYLGLDLADPQTCGIFSLLHDDLFMRGLTRPSAGSVEAKALRQCPRAPRLVDERGMSVPVGPVVARAAVPEPPVRQVWSPSVPRRVLPAVGTGPRDTEEH